MLLPDPTYVLKRELMWLPLFGWLATKARMIPVDRGSHAKALAGMTAAARQEIARGRQIVIFPEGTRRPPGAKPRYLPGVAFLYAETRAALRTDRAQFRTVLAAPLAAAPSRHRAGRSARSNPAGAGAAGIPDALAERHWRKRPRGLSRKAKRDQTGRSADCCALEPFGDQMQIGLAIAQRFQRLHRFQHIVAIGTRATMTLPDVMHALGKRQPSGILHVAAIDDEAQRPHLPPRFLLELDPPHRFQIDGRDLFAGAQIGDGLFARRGGDPKGDAAAHAAAVEPEHQARPLRRAAMDERIDAQRPVQADEPRRHAFDEVEAGTPHQRAIAEDPEVFGVMPVGQFLHRLWSPTARAPPFASSKTAESVPITSCICAKTPPWRCQWRRKLCIGTNWSLKRRTRQAKEKRCRANPPSA